VIIAIFIPNGSLSSSDIGSLNSSAFPVNERTYSTAPSTSLKGSNAIDEADINRLVTSDISFFMFVDLTSAFGAAAKRRPQPHRGEQHALVMSLFAINWSHGLHFGDFAYMNSTFI